MEALISRRDFMRVAAAGAGAAVLAACGAPAAVEEEPATGEEELPDAPPPEIEAEIETWDFGGSEFEFVDSAMIPGFNEQYPNITVKHTGIPEDGYDEKLTAVMAAGNPPDAAVFVDRVTCKLGLVYGLNDMLDAGGIDIKTDYPQGILHNFCMIDDGEVYKIPTQAALWAGAYNIDLFEEAGLPLMSAMEGYDFEDWYNMAAAINKPAENIEERVWGTEMIGMRFNNNVPRFAGEDGRTVVGNIDSEPWIELYTWRKRIWTEELTPVGDVSAALGGNAFAMGQIGITQADYAPLLEQMEQHGVNAVQFQFPKTPKDQDNAAVVGWSDVWSGFKATKYPDALFAWLKYLNTDGAMLRSELTGYPPMYLPAVEEMNWAENNYQGEEVLALLKGMPIYPFNPGVDMSPMNSFWTKITEGGEEVEPALHAAAEELQKVVDLAWEEWEELEPVM